MEGIEISVILPIYNNCEYFEESLDSILNQDFEHFELLVVDDGSEDCVRNILQRYSDERIRYLRNSETLGVASSLNIGLGLSKARFVGRADSDDLYHSSWLSSLYTQLQENTTLAVCGCRAINIDSKGNRIGQESPPLNSKVLGWRLLFENPMVHSSILMRRSLIDGNTTYDETWKFTEDYELWSRLSRRSEIRNISRTLVRFRRHVKSHSHVHHREQFQEICRIALSNMKQYFLNLDEKEALVFLQWHHFRQSEKEQDLFLAYAFLVKLYHAYEKRSNVTGREQVWLRLDFARITLSVCRDLLGLGRFSGTMALRVVVRHHFYLAWVILMTINRLFGMKIGGKVGND